MEFLPSPNFGPRRDGAKIQHLILHYTEMHDTSEFIRQMLDPAVKLSAHYVIDFDGSVLQLVDEANRAWHAGVSFWAGEMDINSTSIGIEIANPGHPNGYVPFRSEQISAVIKLCKEILSRHPDILPQHVLAHSDIAPARKQDPGELFPWALLAQNGIGLWPNQKSKNMAQETDLQRYGYDISNMPAAIAAFQRHYRPEKINGKWDDECDEKLGALLAMTQRI